MSRTVIRLGEASTEHFAVDVDAETAGWRFSGFQLAELAAGESVTKLGSEYEYIAVPMSGSFEVSVDGQTHTLQGRSGVFAGSTDVLYIPRDTDAVITALTDGRISLPAAKARQRLAVQYLAAEDVPIGIRGSGNMSRRAREFCMAGGVKSDRLLALEVITPGGNWSGYPPHKHDVNSGHPDGELNLEELYYFEVSDGPAGDPGFAYQRVFSADERPLDEFAEVHDARAQLAGVDQRTRDLRPKLIEAGPAQSGHGASSTRGSTGMVSHVSRSHSARGSLEKRQARSSVSPAMTLR